MNEAVFPVENKGFPLAILVYFRLECPTIWVFYFHVPLFWVCYLIGMRKPLF